MTLTAEEWEKIRRDAKAKTDAEFAARASGLTHLTDAEILEIAPAPLDREKFAELMGIVSDATKSNQAKANALRTINGLAEMAVTVLGKVL